LQATTTSEESEAFEKDYRQQIPEKSDQNIEV